MMIDQWMSDFFHGFFPDRTLLAGATAVPGRCGGHAVDRAALQIVYHYAGGIFLLL